MHTDTASFTAAVPCWAFGDRYWAVTDECQRLMDAAATAAKGGTYDR